MTRKERVEPFDQAAYWRRLKAEHEARKARGELPPLKGDAITDAEMRRLIDEHQERQR